LQILIWILGYSRNIFLYFYDYRDIGIRMKHSSNIIAKYHYISMFFIMIFAGLLSTMNVWVDKVEDMRLSMNDVYMILLMTGWMFFFMGALYREPSVLLIGLCLVIVNIVCIRTQFLVTKSQYKMGMISHHSMAVHMSRKLLEKEHTMDQFLRNLIRTQESEILILKQ